jgi:hypothetical protein
MRKKSPTLVYRPSMSLTTKTLEYVALAYNLPRGAAVDRGKVAQAAQKTAQAEAPHAARAAQPATEDASDTRLAVSLWPFAALGEGQKPESASSQARGRRGLGPLMRPISEAVIVVLLGLLVGGVAAAVLYFVH